MARTKASVGAKVSSGKSSKARCSVAPPSNSSSSGGSDKSSRSYSGGNPVCPRETPKWQKSIATFFTKTKEDCNGNEVNVATSSKSKPRSNVIESDDDEEEEEDTPKNKELDETIELEPLTGENSHKIDEYYTKHKETKDADVRDKKGKGKGKKSNKENMDSNVRRNSKRDLDDSDENEESRKKIKT